MALERTATVGMSLSQYGTGGAVGGQSIWTRHPPSQFGTH